MAALGIAGEARAGNFPPVAEANASPSEALAGATISFSAASSFDPDEGPSPLAYAWDFGDGATSNEAEPTHVFEGLGLHVVTLIVSDGAAQSLVTLDVVTLTPPTETPPRQSASLALDETGQRLATANTDSDSVTLIDTATGATTEVAVCDGPRNVAWAGARVLVTCFESDELWAIAGDDGSLLDSAPTPREPFGVVERPSSGEVLVASHGAHVLSVFDASLAQREDVSLRRGPRAIAVTADGTSAYVTHFLSDDVGHVSVVNLDQRTVLHDVALEDDPGPDSSSSGRGVPTSLATVAVDPAGQRVWVGGIKANTNRGPTFDGQALEARNRLRGVLAPIALGTAAELLDQRLDTNDADSVSAVAFSPLGRYAYLTHQGAARLSIYDIAVADTIDTTTGEAFDEDARVDTLDAPDGIVVSPDGSRVYVHEQLGRAVAVFDVTHSSAPTLVERIPTTEEPLDPTIALGKRMFYSSREPLHSDQSYIACVSCHPDGGHDGRTWDFTQYGEGRRNTIDLRGHAGVGHGPVHWTANFDEIQDFENDIQFGFGGEGFLAGEAPHAPLAPESNAGRSPELDALAAYVTSLDAFPASPFRNADGTMTDAAQRGYALFFDDALACARCHAPPRFTDSVLTEDPADYVRHLVGTERPTSGQASGAPLVGFDTPTLLGLWATPPYLHDGRAATLREVLTTENPDDQHGVTSHLSDDELDDLVAYLLSLQGDGDEYPAPPGDTGGSSSSGELETDTSGADASGFDSSGSSGAVDAGESSGGPASQSTDSGCGCRSGSPPPALLVLAIFFFARRRL